MLQAFLLSLLFLSRNSYLSPFIKNYSSFIENYSRKMASSQSFYSLLFAFSLNDVSKYVFCVQQKMLLAVHKMQLWAYEILSYPSSLQEDDIYVYDIFYVPFFHLLLKNCCRKTVVCPFSYNAYVKDSVLNDSVCVLLGMTLFDCRMLFSLLCAISYVDSHL